MNNFLPIKKEFPCCYFTYQVLTNLLISEIELRNEESTDIQPYTHQRTVEKVVVPLGDELKDLQTRYRNVSIF